MRQPLVEMQLRTPSNDPTIKRAFGGTFGDHVRGDKMHQGWDLLAAPSTVAYSISKGTVQGVYKELGEYGCCVVIEFIHNYLGEVTKLYALYAHLSSASVKVNQTVEEGEVVARTGTSGNAGGTAPHLHFAIMTSKEPHKGLSNFISPGHVLGYNSVRGLTIDDHMHLDVG